MSYRNERLNKSMRSLEDSAQGIDLSKWRVLSDLGVGVERMVEAIDDRTARDSRADAVGGVLVSHEHYGEDDDRDERLFEAEMRLTDAGKSYLIRVLLLIVENGCYRENSINALTAFSKNWNAARKKYFEHRDRLMEFFKSDSTAHGDIEGHAMPRTVPVTTEDRCNRTGIPSHSTCVR